MSKVAVVSLTPLILDGHPFNGPVFPERMMWTSSSVKLFKRCKRKWFWKYIMRLIPRGRDRNLMIGGSFHECLGEWYTGPRVSMRKISNRYYHQMHDLMQSQHDYFGQDEIQKTEIYIETFRGMMMAYEDNYSEDRRTWNIEPKSIEHQFKVDMGNYDYGGKIDLLTKVKKKKSYIFVEHKTASSIPDTYTDSLPLDTQVRGYIMGAEATFGKVNAVLYDVVAKCKLRRKSNETHDQFIERIKNAYMSEPARYFYREELRFNHDHIDAFRFEVDQVHSEYCIIRGEMEKAKSWADLKKAFLQKTGVDMDPNNPRAWLPNDTACRDFFRPCEYTQLCVTGLDRGTSLMYRQADNMHQELDNEES